MKNDGLAYISSADGHSRFGMNEFEEIMTSKIGLQCIKTKADDLHLIGCDDVHNFHVYKLFNKI